MSHVGDHVSVTDLCRAAGVSERTLEYAFREVMGLTPVAYLIRLRLHRVRQGLLAGTHGSTTVSAEATHWGFWHFGEFSRAYKDCFGELPSETLRRAPGDAGCRDQICGIPIDGPAGPFHSGRMTSRLIAPAIASLTVAALLLSHPAAAAQKAWSPPDVVTATFTIEAIDGRRS